MLYKKKLYLLGSITALLTIIYILTFVFDPVRRNARNERFTWLSAASREEADRIEIFHHEEKFEIVYKYGSWVALLGQQEIPAREGRIDDLFRLLGTRGAFPRRGSNSASHGDLGLDGAIRLVIRGGGGLPLLDLFVGNDDPSGMSVFLRKNGENEFRSGDKLIGTYIKGEFNSWLNLRLFEEISVAQVQRVLVSFRDFYGTKDEPTPFPYEGYTVSRSGENWLIAGSTVEKGRTDNWIQTILETQGDNILLVPRENRDEINDLFSIIANIRLEMGDGTALDLQVEKSKYDDTYVAYVSGKPYMYLLSRWITTGLLQNRDFFL